MTLTGAEREAIVEYRLERAFSAMAEAEYVMKGGYWNLKRQADNPTLREGNEAVARKCRIYFE